MLLFDCNFKLALCSFEYVAISNDNTRKKKVKQSDTPKYVAHVLGGAVSKKYRRQHYNCDTPKYVAHELGGPVSKRYRRLPRTEILDRN